MAGARIDDDKGPTRRIDFDVLRRDDANQGIVHGPLECAAVEDKLYAILEHMRGGLGQVLAVLIAALAHDIPEQDAALRRVDHVFHGWRKQAEHGHGIGKLVLFG